MSTAVNELIANLHSPNDAVRGPAWQSAAPLGAPAVRPLVAVMADEHFETARCARRALWRIVHHAGRPGAEKEARTVAAELQSLVPGAAPAIRRELLWMLSEIGTDDALRVIVTQLTEPEVRNDALCTLARLPGRQTTAALKAALATLPVEFKPAVADVLRRRGEAVRGYPSLKLTPVRATAVSPRAPQ